MSSSVFPLPLVDQEQAPWVDHRIIQKFERLASSCTEFKLDLHGFTVNAETCAKTIQQLRLFMDQALGSKIPAHKRFMTKIPDNLFWQFQKGSATEYILKTYFHFRTEKQNTVPQKLQSFDLRTEENKHWGETLCRRLASGLQSLQYWVVPRLYFYGEFDPELLQVLEGLVRQHDGLIETTPQHATHLILPIAAHEQHEKEIYFEELQSEANRSFVHWWYYPDSWNTWIPSQCHAENIDHNPPPSHSKWRLGYDWILDTHVYNEWMVEADYELTAQVESTVSNTHSSSIFEAFPVTPGIRSKVKLSERGLHDLKQSNNSDCISIDAFDGKSTNSTESLQTQVALKSETGTSQDAHISTQAESVIQDFLSTQNEQEMLNNRRKRDNLHLENNFSTPNDENQSFADDMDVLHSVSNEKVMKLNSGPTHTNLQHLESSASKKIKIGAEYMEDSKIEVAALRESHEISKMIINAHPEGLFRGDHQNATDASSFEKEELPDESDISESKTTQSHALPASSELSPLETAPNVVRQLPMVKQLKNSIAMSKDAFYTHNINAEIVDGSSTMLQRIRATAACIPNGNVNAPQYGLNVKDRGSAIDSTLLPSCSQWFDMERVNQIEQEQLPVLFSDSSLTDYEKERRYLEIRNLIVRLYRKNPTKHLSATDCRRCIDGDASVLLRVHSFLDYWGIINFEVDPYYFSNKTKLLRNRKLQDFTHDSLSSRTSNQINLSNGLASERGSLEESAIDTPAMGHGPWKCAVCGKLCLYTYYVLRPAHAVGLSMGVIDRCVWCLKCFADGKYPSVLNENQFMKVEVPITSVDNSDWKHDEIERLVSGIEMYQEDWDSVAKHVGNGKTSFDCVSFFISMPIREPFMGGALAVDGVTQEIPFSGVDNPLLTQLEFLASVVDPAVASCAAKAALEAVVDSGLRKAPEATTISSDSPQADKEFNANPNSEAVSTQADGVIEQKILESNNDSIPVGYISEKELQIACTTALTAAAMKCNDLASENEKQIQEIMPELINLQLQKLDLQIERYQMIENQIQKDKNDLQEKLESLLRNYKGFDFNNSSDFYEAAPS